jgi:hypothetical protein
MLQFAPSRPLLCLVLLAQFAIGICCAPVALGQRHCEAACQQTVVASSVDTLPVTACKLLCGEGFAASQVIEANSLQRFSSCRAEAALPIRTWCWYNSPASHDASVAMRSDLVKVGVRLQI